MKSRAILEADHLERADRFARGIALSSSFDYMVAVIHNTELAEPFVRRVAGSSLLPGGALNLRWLRWSGVDDALDRLEELTVTSTKERQLLVLDLCSIHEGELESALSLARALNLRRDVLPRALTGGMLLCIPDWLESHFAAAAPDLWSVVSTAALRRGAQSFPAQVLDEWWEECNASFEARRAELDEDLYRHGTYTFAYVFEPGAVDLETRELLDAMRRVPQYTGWAVWLVGEGELAPYPVDGRVEAWMARAPNCGDPGHADFWRADPSGRLYLRRGYLEDARHEAGRVFSAFLPIWRTGEALLHARELGALLGLRDHTRVRLRARWSGLRDRVLVGWPEQDLFADVRSAPSHTAEVVSSQEFELGELNTDLVPLVDELTRLLFECFALHRHQPATIAHHLERLETRT